MTGGLPSVASQSLQQGPQQDSAAEGEIDSVHVQQQDRKRRKVDRNQYLAENSQSTDGENSSQNSVERLQRYDKLDCLNRYLNFDKMSPIHKMTKPFSQCTRKTQTYYTRKTEKTFRSIVKTISFGGNDEEIWNNITPLLKTDKTDNLLVKIYGEIECSWQLRRQVLSIVTKDKTFDEAQKSVPSLTKWRYYESRKHATSVGVGLPILDTPIKRERVDEIQLDHFLDFITSTHVLKDLPYGEKTLRLQSGEIIQIPNVVRSLAATSLIKQYDQLCDEEGFLPLGKSTMYRILTECAASVRQCVEGLDNYVMEGSRAFQELELHIEEFEIPDLKTRLLDAKRYLRTDFKIHLSAKSEVHDHCVTFALSDKSKEFGYECVHQHTDRCKDCSELDIVLQETITLTESRQWENKDAVMFKVEKAVQNIKQLQKHIVRAKNQESGKAAIIQSLKENEAMITVDWAMKFLPRRYREGQMDWFAKRGVNWHFSVAIVKEGENFNSYTIVHIFKGQTSQDAETTSAILIDVALSLRKLTPVTAVHFISDNAGCYKSAYTISALKNGVPGIVSYSFSEAQNGKGPCDRKAAHAKAAIKRYLNEGNDVTSAEDMKKALDKTPGTYYVKIVDAVIEPEEEKTKHSIPNIASLYNFNFEVDGVRVWQAYNVGQGKLIPWESVNPSEKRTLDLTTHRDFDPSITSSRKEIAPSQPKQQWFCPSEGCVKEFSTKKYLDQHLLAGTCELQLEKNYCLTDKAKKMYAKKLDSCVHVPATIQTTSLTEKSHVLQQGWSLKEKKRKSTFNENQKAFMLEKFNQGRFGPKVDPYVAASEMRQSRKFPKEEFLTGQQISSYFSRLSQQQRKADALDLVAVKDEECKEKLRNQILQTLDI